MITWSRHLEQISELALNKKKTFGEGRIGHHRSLVLMVIWTEAIKCMRQDSIPYPVAEEVKYVKYKND